MPEFHREVTAKSKDYSIALILAKIQDLELINDIRNDESTRKNLNNTNVISLSDTKKWFEKESPSWFIIKVDETPGGYIRTSLNTGETI